MNDGLLNAHPNVGGSQQPQLLEVVNLYIESVEHQNTEITLFIPSNCVGVTSRAYDPKPQVATV